MSGLFNGNTTASQVNTTKTTNTTKVAESSDFSAAIESIGAAIGELKDTLPKAMEKAFTDAMGSESTDNLLYNVIASATYDSIGDLYADGKLGGKSGEKSSDKASNGRGFTQADLLALETLDENEKLVNSLSAAFEKSLERSKFDKALDVGSTAAKAAANTAIDTGVETAKGVGKTGLSVGLDATRGALDLVGQVPAGVIESVIARNPGPLLDRLFGSLEKTGGNIIDKGVDGAAQTAKNVSTKTIDNVKQGTQDVADAARSESTPTAAPADESKNGPVEGNATASNNVQVKIPGFDGVGLKPMSGADASRKKILEDKSMDFMTKSAPEFMAKGNEVFDKILADELTVSLDQDIGDSVGANIKNLPWGSMLKGGGMIALGAATIASLGMIGAAGKALWDWHKATEEANKNIEEHAKKNIESNQKMKNGVNDDMRDATGQAMRSEADLAKETNSLANRLLDSFFGAKTQAVMDKEMEAALSDADRKLAQRRHREMRERAAEYGIDVNNADALKKWQEEQKQLALKAGVNVEDKGAFIHFQNEELKRYKEAKKKEMSDGTQPNGQQQPPNAQPNQQPANVPQSNAAAQQSAAPLAAGSTANTAPNAVNAGTGVMTEDIITAEERMKQYKLYTFEGIRDALLLPEVQAMFSNTAQTAGASVEKRLMG